MPAEVRHWLSLHAVRATAVAAPSPWHDHDHLILGAVDRGRRVIETRVARFEVTAGQGFVIPPHLAHRCHSAGSADYRVLCLEEEWSLGAGCLISSRWLALFDEIFAQAAAGKDGNLDSLLVLTRCVSPGGPAPSDVLPGAVRRARKALLDDVAERTTLADLARIAGLSPWHLQRLFSRHLGLSPRAEQSLARLRRACSLLRDGFSLSETATAAGFADQSHLSRIFKSLMGVSPGRYRDQIGTRPSRR